MWYKCSSEFLWASKKVYRDRHCAMHPFKILWIVWNLEEKHFMNLSWKRPGKNRDQKKTRQEYGPETRFVNFPPSESFWQNFDSCAPHNLEINWRSCFKICPLDLIFVTISAVSTKVKMNKYSFLTFFANINVLFMLLFFVKNMFFHL